MKALAILLTLHLTRLAVAGALGGILGTNETNVMITNFNASLTRFQSLITPANYSFMGLHSTNEISELTNTNAIIIYTVPLNRLRGYHAGDNFATLLEPSWSELIIPLVASTNVRSSIALRFNSGRTATTDVKFGQRKLIRELTAMYQSIPPGNYRHDDAPFAVEIPVFDLWLIGYLDPQNQLVLLPVIDWQMGPLILNRGQPLNEANLLQLSTIAQRYNGLPN